MTHLDSPYRYDGGYILLEVPKVPGLPPTVKFNGRTYHLREPLHVSLVAVDYLGSLVERHLGLTHVAAVERVAAAASGAIRELHPELVAYRNELRLADHPSQERSAIIVRAHLAALGRMHELMSDELHVPLPQIPPHVSLYGFPKAAETVGIRCARELGERTRPFTRKEAKRFEAFVDPYKSFRWSMFMTPGPVRNNLILELHVPGFRLAREFYGQFGFEQVAYDPISGGGDSDLGYIELKREDTVGRTQLNFYGDKEHVTRHAHFNQFPADTPRGYAVEITVPVDDVVGLWETVGRSQPDSALSQPLEVKRWGKLDFRLIDPYGFYVRFTEPVDWWQDI